MAADADSARSVLRRHKNRPTKDEIGEAIASLLDDMSPGEIQRLAGIEPTQYYRYLRRTGWKPESD